MDLGHEETEKKIQYLRNRLAKEYKQAQKELKKATNEYLATFKAQDKAKKALVKAGTLSQADYDQWKKNKILYSNTMKQKVDVMAQHLANVDKQAASIINGELPGVYAMNYNYMGYSLEKGLNAMTLFTLHSNESVERLAAKNPKMLPYQHVKGSTAQTWSKRKINSALTQGILQGDDLATVADRLDKVTGMGWSAAYRNARTAMTGAQNAGRMDSLQNAESLGIKVKKQWMATLDERTRASHAELDGESVPVDEEFSNGLMFPGDPEGDPAEVYNCRCTMVGDVEDYPDEEFERWDNIEGKPIKNVTYKEWMAAKKQQMAQGVKPSAGAAQTAQAAKTATKAPKKAKITQKDIDAAEAKVKAAQDEIMAQNANKVFSGIWKENVTYADWAAKKGSIQAKKDYYNAEILKSKPSSVPYLQGKLAELEEFERNGPKFSALFDDLKAAEDELRKIKPSGLADDAYSVTRKSQAKWYTYKTYAEGDKYYDAWSRPIHAAASAGERNAYYEYTSASGGFNRPLAGFKAPRFSGGAGWDPMYYKGPGKVPLNNEGRGVDIHNLTKFVEKSKVPNDVWVQTAQDYATLEGPQGFLGIDYGMLRGMSDAQLQQFVGKVAEFPQFISGSISRGGGTYTPGNVRMNIYLPQGSEALYVLESGAFGKAEREIILQRGGTYRITRMYWGKDAEHGGRKLFVDMELRLERGYDKRN